MINNVASTYNGLQSFKFHLHNVLFWRCIV